MNAKLSFGGLLLAVGVGALAACAAGESETETLPQGGSGGGTGQECTPGETVSCACPGGTEGVQTCLPSGTAFGNCQCDGEGGSGGYDPCGDDFCDSTESCRDCEEDCGPCEPCDIAPNCDGAMIAPGTLTEMPELNNVQGLRSARVPTEALRERLIDEVARATPGMRVVAAALDPVSQQGELAVVTRLRDYFSRFPEAEHKVRVELAGAGLGDPSEYRRAFPVLTAKDPGPFKPMGDEFPGGTMECGAPLLRIGIQKIIVHDAQDAPETDELFCLVESEAQVGAEVRVTPLVTEMGDGDEHLFSNENGVVWGADGPRTPGSALQITYNCIESDTSNNAGYTAIVDAIGNGAGDLGDVYDGAHGWVFPAVEGVSGIVSAAISANSDDQVFTMQNYIPLESQLAMTNGVYWSVRLKDGGWPNEFDWELLVRAWGCAEYGIL